MFIQPSIREILGKNIKKQRIKKNMTQEALAEKCGFSTRYISDIENAFANLTVDKIEALAEALHMNYHELFKDDKK